MEGPLHEAFLSPRKDRSPFRIEKAPPPPLSERPAVDPPNGIAEWIEGYWEWDAGRKDFVWVTGTWRVAPPGRFWVNGYWKRDDQGWYRVPGFWSERKTDRLDYRKNGPPQERPDDEPGEPPDGRTVSISRASTIPMATASSGRRGSGPRSSRAGRGCRRNGFASLTAGSSRKATGTESSRIGELSLRPRRWHRAHGDPTTWFTSLTPRSRPRCTASSTAHLAGRTQIIISPLKALGNDIQRNLEVPAGGIGELAVRAGIGPAAHPRAGSHRRHAGAGAAGDARRPPHILVTTPESLYLC